VAQITMTSAHHAPITPDHT